MRNNLKLLRYVYDDVFTYYLLHAQIAKSTAALKSFSKSIKEAFRESKAVKDITLNLLVSHSEDDFCIDSRINNVRLMRSEVSVVSQLNHENIVKLLGVVISPPSILLEYAPAGNLSTICKNYHQNSQHLLPSVSRATILQVIIKLCMYTQINSRMRCCTHTEVQL